MYKLLIIGIMFLLGFYFIYKSNDVETFTDNSDENKNYKIAENCPDVLIQKGSAFFLYNSKRANVPGINPIRFESLEEYVEFTDWQRSQGILCPILYLQHAYNAQGEPVYKARPSPTNLQGGAPDFIVGPDSLPNCSINMPPSELFTSDASLPQVNMPPKELPPYSNIQRNILPPPKMVPVQGICGQNAQLTPAMPQNSMPMGFTPTNTYNANAYSGANANAYGNANGNANGNGNAEFYPNKYDPQNQEIGLITPLDKMYNQTSGVSPNPMDDNWGGVEYTENLVKSGYYSGGEVNA